MIMMIETMNNDELIANIMIHDEYYDLNDKLFWIMMMITGRGLKAAGRYKRFRDLYCVIEVE